MYLKTYAAPAMKEQLLLPRCPHCSVNLPNLNRLWMLETTQFDGQRKRAWSTYACVRCGGVVLVGAAREGATISAVYPAGRLLSDDIPERARTFLQQSMDSLHTPTGAVMLAASSIDAMLKNKGYREGSLHKRIELAAADHLITSDMAQWAHKVRLDANEQRHADESADLPSEEEAQRCIEFAYALAQFMFVLPALVARGMEHADGRVDEPKDAAKDVAAGRLPL